MISASARPAPDSDIVYPAAVPFLLVHLSCLAAIFTGVTWRSLAICAVLYVMRIFAIGAGYHRYFSHRAFSTSRVGQFVLAVMAQSSLQSSVLWWASNHRRHHLYSDTLHDTHSALHRGFWYSHLGWIFDRRHADADLTSVEDFARYPELRFLHRVELLPAIGLGAICFLIAGWSGLVVGFLWSTVLVWHMTFSVNSLAHMHGKRRYLTGDQSRNNWWIAIATMGEGWHNNHHACQSSVRQGFRWWEFDPTFYLLWTLSKLGLVWDLKRPPAAMLRNEHRPSARTLQRAAEHLVHHLQPDAIAQALSSRLRGADLAEVRQAIARACQPLGGGLSQLRLPNLPTPAEVRACATRLLAHTPHLDEVVDRASTLLLEAVSACLTASHHASEAASARGGEPALSPTA